MRQSISFYLNGELKTLADFPPTMTLLRYLREEEGLCGTKEGCAEGDCGACTLMVSRRDIDGVVKREAINSCIKFLASLDGTSVTTVEALSDNQASAHPVQQAMVEHHGSQCGFCTPGFVMSLFTAYRNKKALPPGAANDVLAGNLCRCTGYGPILDAAKDIGESAAIADQSKDDREEKEELASITSDDLIELGHVTGRAFLPANVQQLADVFSENPEATIIAGATDVGLWVTKMHKALPTIIFLNRVKDLSRIEQTSGEIIIGANATYSDAMDVLGAAFPDFGELIRRIGAVQVRNAGTIGGNIANGSPIGDMPPALISLGAKLVLRLGDDRRTILLENFFQDYGRQDRKPSEFVEAVRVPKIANPAALKCYKISKRFDQDISALCGCFNIEVKEGAVVAAAIAFGGMAGVPKRAKALEAALVGAPWTRATIETSMTAFANDFTPLSDMRASADYRLQTAQNLLLKYFLETEHSLAKTRLVGEGAAFS